MKRLIILLLIVSFIATTDVTVTNVDYFVYYFPSKEALICSDTKDSDGNINANQFQNGNGVTCLVGLNDNGAYRLNLLMASINEEVLSYKRSPLIDVNIAAQNLYKEVDISNDKVVKTITLRKEGGRLFFDTSCGTDVLKCNYQEIPKAMVEQKLLKLNFTLKRMKPINTVLLQAISDKWKPFDIDQECEDDCEHGVCNEGKCLCQSGYYGDDCSKGSVIYLNH
jgi:hypothetical protein